MRFRLLENKKKYKEALEKNKVMLEETENLLKEAREKR